jgi:hypothetical protein
MNVTRSSPSYSFPDDGEPTDESRGSLLSSSNPLPSTSSLSSEPPDPTTLYASEATPEIERWRSSVSNRVVDENRSPYAESVDGPASESQSRATSRLSSNTDHYSAMQHTPGQGVYTTHSSSSLSLASHTMSSPQHPKRRSKTRELPPRTVFSRLLLYPWAALDVITNLLRATQAGVTGRTTTTNPTTPYFIYLSTGLTAADKPNLRSFTSNYITNFEYTFTLSSGPSPIINKTASPPVAYYAKPFESGVTRPWPWRFNTSSPTSTTLTILHPSPEYLHFPRVATRLQLDSSNSPLITPRASTIMSSPYHRPGRRPSAALAGP